MGVLSAAGRVGSIVGQFTFSALVKVSVPWLMAVAAIMLFVGELGCPAMASTLLSLVVSPV